MYPIKYKSASRIADLAELGDKDKIVCVSIRSDEIKDRISTCAIVVDTPCNLFNVDEHPNIPIRLPQFWISGISNSFVEFLELALSNTAYGLSFPRLEHLNMKSEKIGDRGSIATALSDLAVVGCVTASADKNSLRFTKNA